MIENEARYEAAIQRNIKNNRCKGNRKRWEQESGVDVVTRCIDFLSESGEFSPIHEMDEDGYILCTQPNPLVKVSRGDFFYKMLDAIHDWGRLSSGQERAVLSMIENASARIEAREAAKEAKIASAQHIGIVGERCDFDLTLKFKTTYETRFGFTTVYVMEDGANNVVVYKGSSYLTRENGDVVETGDRVKFKATVKAHGERDGVKQTIVSRPKMG